MTFVLFAEPHHGARSQIAEALLRSAAGDRFEIASAGTDATGLLDGVEDVLREVGIGGYLPSRRLLTSEWRRPPAVLVIVCEEECGSCPYVPGAKRVLRWPQPDPDRVPAEERLSILRRIRGDLQLRIAYLVNLPWNLAAPAR